MSRVIADISISVDGYVTGPDAGPTNGLGTHGEGIHAWVLEEPRSPIDDEVLARSYESTGAVILGRRLFDVVDGPDGWNDDVGYGYDQDQSVAPPCFVVTHEPPEKVRLASRFRFVTGGVAEAVRVAGEAAGDKDVVVMGGANVVDQCLADGLVDELRIHYSPLLVGAGTRLFTLGGRSALVQREVIVSPRATHVTYDVVDESASA
ncbi:dihydrofolate reductase family protein [Leifsonia poae]|uniref:DNA-binding protein n=1 Tax=Leifsonia poae TaxID=110933 RepID=A0A9W6H6A0_9MICO|nr:dihydrofolate reductase family protein [Leifsonia poae]GLJ74735.1 DNA-binding protein [Leifsonia poae]